MICKNCKKPVEYRTFKEGKKLVHIHSGSVMCITTKAELMPENKEEKNETEGIDDDADEDLDEEIDDSGYGGFRQE